MARKPDRLSNQIQALQKYLRSARANYTRAYTGVAALIGKRRICPFEQQLRHRRFEDGSRLLKLAELCLAELRHQRALSLAPFQPGDQIRVSVTVKGYAPALQRYLILDLEWNKRDTYVYVVRELTEAGRLHRGRHRGWVCPKWQHLNRRLYGAGIGRSPVEDDEQREPQVFSRFSWEPDVFTRFDRL